MSLTTHEREQYNTALAYISQVKEKIRRGEYPTEETKCFCGSANDLLLVEKDRYGLPHRMVICQSCALIRTNPRLTPESYHSFYNKEYRVIYYDDVDAGQRERGRRLKGRLVELDITMPKVVVEIGCHHGGMLEVFQKAGAEVWGVEIDQEAAEVARSKGIRVVSRIEELEDLKADLVIMQDVIEHLTDLNEMPKVGKLLSPSGVLYVWTPGFFCIDTIKRLWQIAHTFQFCARSLEYVMGELGFDQVYLNEDIESFWHYSGPERSLKFDKPGEWTEYICDDVFPKEKRRMPPFRGTCKFTPQTLYENIDLNLSKRLPDLYEISKKYSGPIILLAGGPSVDGQVEKIRELKEQGIPLMAISRMYPWCKANALRPDFVVSLDCMEEQEKGFTDIQPEVIYLLASVTRPSIFDKLKNERCYVWDTKDDRKVQKMRLNHGYQVATVINGGGSVAVACLSLAMNLGFKDLHIFGLDCMFPSTLQSHASGIAGESVKQNALSVEIDGEEILTSGAFLEFARQSLDLISSGHEEGLLDSAKVYGESLINKMWDGRFDHEEAA